MEVATSIGTILLVDMMIGVLIPIYVSTPLVKGVPKLLYGKPLGLGIPKIVN